MSQIVLCPSGDGGITCQDEYNKILRENCDCNLGGGEMGNEDQT